MKCFLFVCLFAITFAKTSQVLQSENAKLRKTNQVLIETLKELAVGSKAEEQVAGGCYTESGSCKSGYYKLSGGLRCCPRLSEESVARSRDSCLRGCQRLGSSNYAACEKRCYGYLEKSVSDWDSHDHDHDGNVDHDSEDHHSDSSETSVGFYGTYKCTARNNCIYDCQADDESKSWYACMKECPKSLCDKDSTSDSIDPEDDSEEEAVGLTCSKDGFEGTVTSDSWCDKRDGVWKHKCSGCKHGYYWYWWHTYCCTRGKGGCTCAYN